MLCQSYVHLTELLKDKNTSIARLRKMLFGASTEKTAAVIGGGKDSNTPSAQDVAAGPATSAAGNGETASAGTAAKPWSATEGETAAETPRKGHGRNGADAYSGAEKIEVPHESLQPGDPCPECEEGTVYETARPGV